MGADQVNYPDMFNITRGGEDPSYDIDEHYWGIDKNLRSHKIINYPRIL